jgi:hypothetical protein
MSLLDIPLDIIIHSISSDNYETHVLLRRVNKYLNALPCQLHKFVSIQRAKLPTSSPWVPERYVDTTRLPNNALHSINDMPAYQLIEFDERRQFWYHNQKYHRVDNPAIKYTWGITNRPTLDVWMQYGVLHRGDGPAIVFVTKCNHTLRLVLKTQHSPLMNRIRNYWGRLTYTQLRNIELYCEWWHDGNFIRSVAYDSNNAVLFEETSL